MTITILELTTYPDALTGAPGGRTARLAISDGVNTYPLNYGGIPLAGDAQAWLDAQEASLLAQAQALSAPNPQLATEVADRAGAAGNALESRTLAEALNYIETATTVAALKLVLKEIVKQLYYMRRVMEAYIRNHP